MLDFGGVYHAADEKLNQNPPKFQHTQRFTVDFLEFSLAFAHGIAACGCFQKYGYPKMDGENNGNPY